MLHSSTVLWKNRSRTLLGCATSASPLAQVTNFASRTASHHRSSGKLKHGLSPRWRANSIGDAIDVPAARARIVREFAVNMSVDSRFCRLDKVVESVGRC